MPRDQGILFDAIRRGWWMPLAATLVAVGVAWWATSRETPQYAAEAFLVVAPDRSLDDPSDVLRSIDTLDRRTVLATLARIPGRDATKEKAGERLGWDAAKLRHYWIGGSVVPQTNILRVEARGPNAEGTARLATAAADATRREGDRVYRVYYLRMLEEAEVPRRPVRPRPGENLLAAAILGLFVGLASALALEVVRRRPPDRA